ncbi:MAG: prolyl oligopeptidase family serine peptidase [Rickettsiales bacterium]
MIVSSEKFIPHSLEHLTENRVFPSPLPESFYDKICREYFEISDVISSRFFYESDGFKVSGITAFPAEINNGSHPILIYNRGGNREFGKLTVLSVMRSMLPFARAGYLVYASNYRGNDGGEGKEEFGGADVNDVLNLVEIAKKNPAWDGRNIFMLGHSRGGMMNILSMRDGLSVNAVVSIAGVSDLRQAADNRPILEEQVYKKIIPNYLENPKKLLEERSAICHLENVSAPVLLMHGTKDEAVPMIQSQDMAEKLSALGKEHDLIIYEGGNHALIRHWDDVLDKSLAWFARYRI